MSVVRETPLGEIHRALGGKMVDFAGFAMPVTYGSIIDEHNAVRERAGLFDVSHMGEFVVTGAGAKEFVNEVITNDCTKLAPGGLQYSVMCREDGTVVDDLLVFVVEENRILLVVNAANVAKDIDHIRTFDHSRVELTDASEEYALLAVQGPRSVEVLRECATFATVKPLLAETAYYNGFGFEHKGGEVLVSRTGYTGELGFEVFVAPANAAALWEEIMATGAEHGMVPAGLGARDTLRFEASYCLYGHELDDETTPLETGLGWVVKLKKKSFRGLDSLRAEKKNGPRRKLVGLELQGRRIARQGYVVFGNGDEIGRVTSGVFSPTLQKSLCMALVDHTGGETGTEYHIDVRGKRIPARMTPIPFYKSRAK